MSRLDDEPARPGEAGVAAAWLVAALRDQAVWCELMGSPLYAGLLRAAAADVAEGGPLKRLLLPHAGAGRSSALALRLMAAAHRLVLTGAAPSLAVHYPSSGGRPRWPAVWHAFRALVEERAAELDGLVRRPCQTNEVGRAAALIGGFLELAAGGRPLRVLEVGASAGLLLRWDAFYVSGGGASWGDPASPVRLEGFWEWPAPCLGARVDVVERRGCDPRPIDPDTEEGALSLRSSVWADQTARFERLKGALELARRAPVSVDVASVDAWLPGQLAARPAGVTTVVYQSVVDEYLDPETRRRAHAALEEAGRAASAESPLAWLRLEPLPAQRAHAVELRAWPGGERRLIASCGAHGSDVRWKG